MTISQDYPLINHNTFKISATAHLFTDFKTIEDLITKLQLPHIKNLKKLILGGGSNILFTKNFDGVILKNNIKGIHIIKEKGAEVFIKSGAGETWQDFVNFCIDRNLGGVENLSLIPGTVGASPIQNIGAYGVEIKDVLQSVEALEIESFKIKNFSNAECQFGYRDSIFKKQLKEKYIITSVTYKLSKNPVLNISYGAIKETISAKNILNPSVKDVSEAVCEIRRSKLPDPAILGNAGSFFKNPEVDIDTYQNLKIQYPDMPSFPTAPGKVKIPAGWLIEKLGWKGKTIGLAGVHKNQALVLVNYGGASGEDIKKISEDIKESVNSKFRILLETEVNII